jgi:hypothetical protein
VFRCREASAVADEALHLAAARVHRVEALHGEQVVDAGIDADLERILQISFGRNL